MKLFIWRPIAGFPRDLSVGASVSNVRSVLGEPLSEKAGTLVYSLSNERPGQDTIAFEIQRGRVVRVVWDWELD